MRELTLSLLLSAALITSCKKDDQSKTIPYEYFSDELKPYLFKNDSYWVYQNDSTNILDSVYITNIKHDFFGSLPSGPGQGPSMYYEYYKIYLHGNYSSVDYVDFLFDCRITRNGNENPNFGQPILLLHSTIGDTIMGAVLTDTIPSLTVLETTFYKIKKMKIIYSDQNQSEFSHDTYLYYKDSVGLIKKVIDLGGGNFESWSLKRWKTNL